jgi:universal stress protein E
MERLMSKQPRIMVIMEGKPRHSPALLRALSLAIRMGASLHLRSFDYLRSLEHAASRGFDLPAYLRGRRAELEEFAASLPAEGAPIDTQVVWGRPLAEKIIYEVLALKPDLVIKDAPGHTDPRHTLLDSIDWHLLNECPAPLMLVRPRAASLPRRIVAAVDPLDEHGKPHVLNDRIVGTAASLAAQCGAELDVVNAFEYIPAAGEWEYAGLMPDLTLYSELRKVHAEGLYRLGKDHGVPPARMHILDGEAAYCVTGFARQHRTDLVVMGSIYRTGLKQLFLGSTAEGVFDTLACDVLLIKPDGFAAELQDLLEHGKARAA